jgi:putative ABC transport system permease protein
MFRNYLISALRNLARNRFYSAISIASLAVGLSAALLTALVIRNQLSYDHFIRNYPRTYLAGAVLLPSDREPLYDTMAPSFVAAHLKFNFSEVEAATRLLDQDVRLRRGAIESKEKIYWADPNAFDVLTLPVFAGNLEDALHRPDGIVLTRSIARKYFGREDPIGESLLLDGSHAMTVTAVIEDLPVNGTELESGLFASGVASFSPLTQDDNNPNSRPRGPGVSLGGRTYLQLLPNASVDNLQRAMPGFVRNLYPELPPGVSASLQLIRIDQVNLFPPLNPGVRGRLAAMAIVGVLILTIGCVVFVNLSTARSMSRALEVSIRKVSGASRSALVLQFIGESLVYVLLAAVAAVALTELLIPRVNAFLNAGAVFEYWRDPRLCACMLLGALTVAVLAGAYPAFVLSAIRPANALKKSLFGSRGVLARQSLVALQFAVLIGFLVSAAAVYQQLTYATRDALRVDSDQMLIIRSPCNPAFEKELRSLAGVLGVFCSTEAFLDRETFSNLRLRGGGTASIDMIGAEFGIFDLYGPKPLAGRFDSSPNSGGSPAHAGGYIINEAAVRQFGFRSATAAIGQSLPIVDTDAGSLPSDVVNEITAVVPDFAIHTIEQNDKPAIYYLPPPDNPRGMSNYGLINVKLTGRDIPETLSAIDRLWLVTGNSGASDRFFLNHYIQTFYLGILREVQACAAFAVVAALLACLGLIGLSASATERRTKEIGIRRAMGAGTGDVVLLLVWQFCKPVLWANVIAWPIAGAVMSRWLHGFARHVELAPWTFMAAGAIALIFALITVSGQSFFAARANPVTALRYE